MGELQIAWDSALNIVADKKWGIPFLKGEGFEERNQILVPALNPNVLIVSGPTGVGKSTILSFFEERTGFRKFPNVFTRDPRPGERLGVDLIYMTEEEFIQAEEAGRFLQTNERHGYHHGLLRKELLQAAESDRIYLDKSAPSTADLLERLPENIVALAIYILPPSFTELWRRINGRAQEIGKSKHENPIERIATSIREFEQFGHIYRAFVVNDEVDRAVDVLCKLTLGR